MVLQLVYCLLLASLALPHCSFGEIVFRCPSCTAERLAACPKLTATCEVVREPGCGCCPVCARKEGEACGVYTPRCGNGFRCYPSPDAQLPLDQLVRGFGRCGPRVDLEHMSSHEFREISGEIYGTKSPAQKKTTKDPNYWHIREAVRQHQIEQRTRMLNRMEEPKTPRPRQVMQSHCQQELDRVLEDIAKMTFLDNKGPLENLYDLKFPNCDKEGQYNLKQCHMSNHGQRGECWCVNPHTGIQIPSSPKVRGDPNCSQFLGGPETEPPTAVQI